MSVSEHDLRHVASLARIGVPAERVPALLAELNGILAHLAVLRDVDTGDVDPVLGVGAGGMRLREDDGEAYPMLHSRESLAPTMRDGFYVVPRLASHADVPAAGRAAPAEGA